MHLLGFDTEAYYDKKSFTVKDLGYYKYTRDPRFDCYQISVSDGKESWAGHPRDFNFDATKGAILLSHNKAYDEETYLAELERGRWPKMDFAAWHCTANMSSYLWNVRSLADACKWGLGVHIDKGVRDRASGKHWEDIVREGWAADMLTYGCSDAQRPVELWVKHSHKWPEFERILSDITILQGRTGVHINTVALDKGMELMREVIFAAENSLPWIARGRAPASPIGLAEECRLVGIPCAPVKSKDPEEAAEWEETYAPKFPFVMALRNLRKAKKTLATLETIKLRLKEDGTVAFSLKYAGAHTLRWAGDAGWNLQNQNKDTLFVAPGGSFILDKAETSKLTKQCPPGVRSLDMRGLIVAPPGKMLYPVDLEQIEPRVLNWLAGNEDLLKLVAGGMSVYEAHARASMGWTGGDLKKENPYLYQLAKIRVLGLGYGCSWAKFITIAAQYGIDLREGDKEAALKASVDGKVYTRYKVGSRYRYDPDVAIWLGLQPLTMLSDVSATQEFVVVAKETKKGTVLKPMPVEGMRSRSIVEDFRQTNPKIVALWRTLQEGLENSVGMDFVVEGPHGGTLVYRDVRLERREAIDEDTGEPYTKQVYTAVVGGKRVVTYGAKIAENLVQWVARMVFAENMVKLVAAGYKVLFSVHDEAVLEVEPNEDTEKIDAIMSSTPAWLQGCPIGAAGKLTARYNK